MIQGLVSIVVPVYNTEKYLDRCVESLVNQTWPHIEILLVDDGSTDASPRICDNWAKKDSRIRVFHKANEGQGNARNLGIDNATGDYICFVDSDDYMSEDMVEKMVSSVSKTGSELAICGFHSVDRNGKVCATFVPDDSVAFFHGSQVTNEFLTELVAPDFTNGGKRRFYMSAWVMLYSMKRIRESGWRFVSERKIVSEDVYSLLRLMQDVKSVSVVPEALYYYCENETSFSRRYTPGRYERVKHFYIESTALARRLSYSEEIQLRLTEPFLAYTIGVIKQEAAAPLPLRQRMRNLRAICVDAQLQHVLARRKGTGMGTAQNLLFFALRKKMPAAVFLMAWIKNQAQA